MMPALTGTYSLFLKAAYCVPLEFKMQADLQNCSVDKSLPALSLEDVAALLWCKMKNEHSMT